MPFFYIEAYTAPSKFGPFFKYKIEVWDINGICVLNVPSFLKSNQANTVGGPLASLLRIKDLRLKYFLWRLCIFRPRKVGLLEFLRLWAKDWLSR